MDPHQQYQQQHSQQQQAGFDVNPYYKPYQGPSYPIANTSSHSAPVPANAYEYDVGILAQQSVYVPGAMIDKRGGAGGKLAKGGKRTTVLRKGGGKVWEDQTLLEWNPGESLTFYRPNILLNCNLKHGFACLSEISVMMCLTMFSRMPSTNIPRSRRRASSATGSVRRYCFVIDNCTLTSGD